MPLTPNSGAVPYCTPADMVGFHDSRDLGELVRDDSGQDSPVDLASDPVLALALAAASGDLESAALIGQRYEPADLQSLVGNGRAFLARLVAALAYGHLRDRRNLTGAPPAFVADAEAKLQALAKGEAILPFVQVEAAGNAYDALRDPNSAANRTLLSRSPSAMRFMGRATRDWGRGDPWGR